MTAHQIWLLILVVADLAVIARAILLDGRDPYSRAAWVMTILILPLVGIILYGLLGEPWMSHRFRRRAQRVSRRLQALSVGPRLHGEIAGLPDHFLPAFRTAEALAEVDADPANSASLTADSNDAVDAMVRDIDAARQTVHISVYIWLTDRNGVRMVEALLRAARRGIDCRVAADALGSHALIRSDYWREMKEAGIALCPSLSLPRGLRMLAIRRLDLRNHRKIVVIDSRITYCGSQNFADPEFRIKPSFAPWVDIMLRLEGPIALQNQLIFASDWTIETGEDLGPLFANPPAAAAAGDVTAVAFATGPLSPKGGMSNAFVSLLYAARREVVVTTPYFVPDPPLLAAMIGCARRGVDLSIILPQRNDSAPIGAISKSLYPQLLRAGARIFEYRGGLLHSKTIVADREVVLIGSANMDRRSLELNFENNMLLFSPTLAEAVRARQDDYLAKSVRIDRATVERRSIFRRFVENLLTMAGAVF